MPTSDAGTDSSPILDSGVGGQGSGGKGSGGKGSGGAGGASAGGTDAGSGGAGTGGGDASTADVSVPQEAGTDSGLFSCQTPGVPDGSVTGDSGPNGQWRDFATHECKTCPANPVTCGVFDERASSYDFATRRLTIILNPSITELVRVQGSLNYEALLPDAGYQYGYVTSVDFQISGNVLTADLSSLVPFDVYSIANVRLQTQDVCGTVTNVDFGLLNNAADAHKPAVDLHCEI